MIQSGNVLYTYTKRFACFAVSVFLMTRRVFVESVFFAESVFSESGAYLPSQFLLSQLFADSNKSFAYFASQSLLSLTRRVI